MAIPPSTGNPFKRLNQLLLYWAVGQGKAMAQPTKNQHVAFSVETRRVFCLVAQDTPSNLMWFPSPQATMQRQQTIKKAMMCMRHLSSLIWKAASTFSRCKKKTTSNSKQNPRQEHSSAMVFASDMIFAKFSNHLKWSNMSIYSICCKLAHFNFATPYTCQSELLLRNLCPLWVLLGAYNWRSETSRDQWVSSSVTAPHSLSRPKQCLPAKETYVCGRQKVDQLYEIVLLGIRGFADCKGFDKVDVVG